MRNRTGQLNVCHPLAADFGLGDLNAALLADYATMLEPLVLPAQAFIVLDGTKNFGAEKPITLRLEGPIVNRFRLLDLAKGPAAHHFR